MILKCLGEKNYGNAGDIIVAGFKWKKHEGFKKIDWILVYLHEISILIQYVISGQIFFVESSVLKSDSSQKLIFNKRLLTYGTKGTALHMLQVNLNMQIYNFCPLYMVQGDGWYSSFVVNSWN